MPSNKANLTMISRQISSIQMLSFIDDSCSRINILFPYYFSLIVLSSYILQVITTSIVIFSVASTSLFISNQQNKMKELTSFFKLFIEQTPASTAPNVGNLSLQAEMIYHLNQENFTIELRFAAIDQHQKSASSSRTDKQFEEKRASEKFFKCNTCDKQFNRQFKLQQHNLKHKSEKSFTCKLCEKAFNLQKKLPTHTNPRELPELHPVADNISVPRMQNSNRSILYLLFNCEPLHGQIT
ncbi:zinc finger, C2H2 type [Onchocerca flexuosa]|uniref:Zinc finger, C2H2 type n=1 Tax=Onchocerca flexuosa TaxID=387005 RepID=A0A238BNF9_9BILA|nr:zinc finger, C2H2 type [Onchocerca flexuosa]